MAFPRSHKFLHKWPLKSSNFFGCQGCHSSLCRFMDMPGLWLLKCIWSRTWEWASRQGHQQIRSSTNPAFLENSYSKKFSSISYFWMKLIIAAKQIEINNGSKLFIFFFLFIFNPKISKRSDLKILFSKRKKILT